MAWADEKIDGVRFDLGEQRSGSIEYLVFEAVDFVEAMEAAVAAAPPVAFFMTIVGVSLGEELIDDPVYGHVYQVTVKYGEVQRKEVGDEEVSFTTSGGTEKRTQSYGTRSYPSASSPETKRLGGELVGPDFQGAINVTENGVDGVDVPAPKLELTIKKIFPADWDILASAQVCSYLTGAVNSAPWRKWDAGEVQFLGAEATQKGNKPIEATFKFAISKNADDLQVGDIGNIRKLGWEYLWIRYRQEKDETAGVLVRVASCAYVEEVNRYANFRDVGLLV